MFKYKNRASFRRKKITLERHQVTPQVRRTFEADGGFPVQPQIPEVEKGDGWPAGRPGPAGPRTRLGSARWTRDSSKSDTKKIRLPRGKGKEVMKTKLSTETREK